MFAESSIMIAGFFAGKKAPRRYLPKKNSAPYAILITLYRWTFSCGPLNFAFDLSKKARGG
jgi:hypothetical protein